MDWLIFGLGSILIGVPTLLLYLAQVGAAPTSSDAAPSSSDAVDPELYLYHYTTPEGFIAIRSSRRIQMSRSALQDAVFGDGVYLTSMTPGHGRNRIVANNYDDQNFLQQYPPQMLDKVNFYIRFRKCDLPGVRSTTSTRDVWLYRGDILLDDVRHRVGETEATAQPQYDGRTGAMTGVTFQ